MVRPEIRYIIKLAFLDNGVKIYRELLTVKTDKIIIYTSSTLRQTPTIISFYLFPSNAPPSTHAFPSPPPPLKTSPVGGGGVVGRESEPAIPPISAVMGQSSGESLVGGGANYDL